MTKINNCTLCIVDCYYFGAASLALKKSMEQNQFDRVIFLTDIPIKLDGVEVIKIPTIRSKREYSHFVVKELYKYITTDFVLHIQHDGFTRRGDLFDERLYDYDWAGALWMENDGYANGNGGYKWVSRKLLEAVGTDEFIKATHPEDAQLCRTYRDYLEVTYGLKWATDEICEGFSYELREPTKPTMGFHGNFYPEFKPTVVVTRKAALGDVVSCEPVLDHFHKQGYRVCLDTLPQFFNLFQQHYFPILHPSQLDGRVPVKNVNLDMSYEAKPDQLHLKTYYEFAGIEDGEIRNPRLHLSFDARSKEYKLFPKYCVIHDDMRGQPYRNIYGIDWDEIAIALKFRGYTVVQIGKGEHKPIEGAIQFNTSTEALLLMTCAGADLFLGIDSGIAHICSAFQVPSIIFFGSVNPEVIYPFKENKIYIHNHFGKGYVCDTPFCWSDEIGGTSGKECVVNKEKPPCTQYTTIQLLKAINQL